MDILSLIEKKDVGGNIPRESKSQEVERVYEKVDQEVKKNKKPRKMLHMNRLSTSYPSMMLSAIKRVKKRYDYIKDNDSESNDAKLFFHQYLLREIFTDPIYGLGEKNQSRGFIIYHDTGTGKTKVAASILLALIDKLKVVVLVKKSLKTNLIDAIESLIPAELKSTMDSLIKFKLNFLTANAYNVADMAQERIGKFDNTLVIIDEFHTFINGVITSKDGNTNKKKLFDMMMKGENIKFLLLSGTPIISDPFSLVPTVNLLTGQETLPESFEMFQSQYIKDDRSIKNADKLRNRLFGLVSRVKESALIESNVIKNNSVKFPKKNAIQLIEVPMSKPQFSAYITARSQEEHNKSIMKDRQKERSNKPKPSYLKPDVVGSYYIASRQVSNYYDRSKFIEDKPKEEVRIYDEEHSPKIHRLTQHISQKKLLSLVYSQFIDNGLDIVAKYLSNLGYVEYDTNISKMTIIPSPRYAFITGQTNNKDKIIEIFNSPANKRGDIIQVLLVSETGAEGLDLKNGREIHILEPYFIWARHEQIIARFVRANSHIMLDDESEHQVDIYIYCAVHPKDYKVVKRKTTDVELFNKTFEEEETIDIYLYKKGLNNQTVINEFNALLESVSIECQLFKYPNCYTCQPDDNTLYTLSNLSADIEASNPCKPNTVTNVKVKTILIKEIKYYYKEDSDTVYKYRIYYYDRTDKNYKEMSQSNKLFKFIIDKIQEQEMKSKLSEIPKAVDRDDDDDDDDDEDEAEGEDNIDDAETVASEDTM